jgi:hypothetical protein
MTNNDPLTQAIRALSDQEKLTDDRITSIVQTINLVLHDKNADIDWDDAWDTIYLLGPMHSNAIPSLCRMIHEHESNTDTDSYPRICKRQTAARIWAVRSIAKIGTNASEAVSCLQATLENSNGRLRREAAKALRMMGHKHLVKRKHWWPW